MSEQEGVALTEGEVLSVLDEYGVVVHRDGCDLRDLAARLAAQPVPAPSEAYPHGVAWQDNLNIICLCGQVCTAEMGKNPAGGFMGRPGSGTYVRRPAAQAFAQHLLDERRILRDAQPEDGTP